MDWGRAKWILIVSFFMLNVLLGYQLWTSRLDPTASATDGVNLEDETRKLLALKTIKITANVPKDTPKLPQLTGKLSDKYLNVVPVQLKKPIPYSGGFLGKTTLHDVLLKIGIDHLSSYKLDSVLSGNGVYSLTQMEGDYPLFEYTVQLYEQDDQITGYKQAYIEVQSGGEPKQQRVISAFTAIRSLANDFLPEGSTIRDVRLGYHGIQYNSETQYMLPFWRIVTDKGDPYYVQAFTGEVLEGSQAQTPPADAPPAAASAAGNGAGTSPSPTTTTTSSSH